MHLLLHDQLTYNYRVMVLTCGKCVPGKKQRLRQPVELIFKMSTHNQFKFHPVKFRLFTRSNIYVNETLVSYLLSWCQA